MKDKLNCPNCGAPLDGEKCFYCGTTFYDFASLEIGTPCYIRLKFGDTKITLKAIPDVASVNIQHNYSSAYDARGTEVMSFCTGQDLNLDVHFRTVNDNGKLLTIESR